MATLAALETLATEQSAYFRAINTANEARAESRLFDAAVDAGMDWQQADLHGWVARIVGQFLSSCDDYDDEPEEGIGTDEYGRWEYVA